MRRRAGFGARLRPGGGAGLLLCLVASALGLQAGSVSAEEPRDAIKRLPDLTHQSVFESIGADGSAGQARQDDNYLGTWDLNWWPGTVSLPGGVRLTPGIGYRVELSDRLNRLGSSSTDSRGDIFDFQLRLEQEQRLQANFTWHRGDRYSGAAGSDLAPDMQVEDFRSFNLSLAQPGLPTFSVGGTSGSNFSSAAEGQTGSDNDKLSYTVDFTRDFQSGMTRARMQAESWRSRIYRDGSENSGDRTYVEAAQRLNLGAIGNLNMGYYFEEVSQIGSGSLEPSVVSSNRLSLNLDGSVNLSQGAQPSPLGYGLAYANYSNRTLSGAVDNTYNRAERNFNFRLTPPVPAGKSAQFSYATFYWEDEYFDRRTSAISQDLRWDFSPNKLTSAGASYNQQRETDELRQLRNKEIDRVQAWLNYKIPGERGSLSSSYAVGSERYPSNERQIDSSSLNLSNTLNLGTQAVLVFSYAKSYTDTQNLLFRTDGNDYSRAAVQYRINTSNRVNLDATWSQQSNRYLAGNKRDSQNLGLVFSYAAPHNWSYTLRLNSNDDHEDNSGGSVYRNGETMQAIVTYTF